MSRISSGPRSRRCGSVRPTPCIDFRQRAFGVRVAERRRPARGRRWRSTSASTTRAGIARPSRSAGRSKPSDCSKAVEPCPELGSLAGLRAIVALAARARRRGRGRALRRVPADRPAVQRRGCDRRRAWADPGIVLVRQGRVAEGLRLVDESMISAVSGLLGTVMTARVYCNTISVCQALGDIRRASEWTEQALVCSSRPGMGDFPGDCRMHRAEITRLRGDWVGRRVGAARRDGRARTLASRARRAGVVRARRDRAPARRPRRGGRRVRARRGLRQGSAARPRDVAPRRRRRGDRARRCCASRSRTPATAIRCSSRSCCPRSSRPQIACGDVQGAAEAAERLAEIAAVYGTVVLEARATTSRARVALASGATRRRAWPRRAPRSTCGATRARPTKPRRRSSSSPRSRCAPATAQVAIVELDAALAVFRDLGRGARHRGRAAPPGSAGRRRGRSPGSPHVHVHRHRRLDAARREHGRRAWAAVLAFARPDDPRPARAAQRIRGEAARRRRRVLRGVRVARRRDRVCGRDPARVRRAARATASRPRSASACTRPTRC